MQTGVDVVITIVAWAVTIWKMPVVLRNRRWAHDERVLRSWAFALFFALSITFQVDVVYLAVDAFTGVNNLSWLAAYVCLALAIYFVSTACCMAMRVRQPGWILPYLVVTLGLFAAIFPLGVATIPEWTEHTAPRSGCDLLFMQFMYVYAIVLGAIPALAFARFTRHEGAFPTRIRTGVTLLAVILALVYFLTKCVVSLLAFFYPSSSLVSYLATLAMVLTGASGLLWSLVFAPNRLYLSLARPFTFCEKVLTLKDLKQLQARLNRLCPPVAPGQATWWERLKNLDFYIYRAVIGILDGKKMLADYLEVLEAEQGSGDALSLSKGHRLCRPETFAHRWDGRAIEEAIRLHQALQGAPEPQDFQRLVAVYRDIGRRLKVSTGLNPGVSTRPRPERDEGLNPGVRVR